MGVEMALEQQKQFLEQVPPFSLLPQSVLEQVAGLLDVLYFPTGKQVPIFSTKQGYLYFVIKGRLAEYQQDELTNQYGIRSYFGEQCLMGQKESADYQINRFIVREEAILYRLPGEVFLALLDEHADFKRHFHSSMVEKLNAIHQSMQVVASTEVMMDTVCSAPIQSLVLLPETATLQQAVQKMVAEKTDACVVEFETAEEQYGIITSTDILRIVANGQYHDTARLQEVAKVGLVTVHEFDYLFNALLKMTRFQIDRLVVRSDNGLKGFLTIKDLMGLFANQSGLALLRIEQATSVEEFKKVSEQIDGLVGGLQRKGIKPHYIAKLVNELNRKVMTRLFTLFAPEVLIDRVCFLVMGSEGRSEQILKTDQDNALLYRDLSELEVQQVNEITIQFNQALIEIGFPPCPGNVMITNPVWRQSVDTFSAQVREWFDKPTAESFMNLSIFADAQVVFGDESLLKQVRKVMLNRLNDQPILLSHFAKATLQFETPIGFFGGLVTEKSAGHERIDIKKAGIFPIVHGVRCYALRSQLEPTNTHWRIKALIKNGVLEHEFGIELGEALNFFNTLRLESMLQQESEGLEAGKLHNFIDLLSLSHLQQDLLKQALGVVNRFKKRVQRQFKLNEVL